MEKENVLDILIKTRTAIEQRNTNTLKEISNRTIHSASVFQDKFSILLAVMIYSFAKIFERSGYREYEGWDDFYASCLDNLKKAITDLGENKFEELNNDLKKILEAINLLEGKLNLYVKQIFHKAKISKASRVYEHGISASKTAELFGITKWELMEYIGNTEIADAMYSQSKTMKERLKSARDILGV